MLKFTFFLGVSMCITGVLLIIPTWGERMAFGGLLLVFFSVLYWISQESV